MLREHAWRFFLVCVIVAGLALALPAVASADNGGGRVNVFSSVNVRADEVINGDVGSVFGSVNVLGRVNGNVFSIFGSVNISGQAQVEGDVFTIFGSVSVSGNAVVQGDAFSVFSEPNVVPPARVSGSTYSAGGDLRVEWPEGPWRLRFDGWTPGTTWRETGWRWADNILSGLFSALVLAAIGVVAVVLFPRQVNVVKDTIVHSPGASFGVGFLGLLLSVPLALLLVVTCIGPFIVAIATFLATLFGLVAIGLLIGQRIMDSANNQSRSLVTDVAVGTLVMGLIMAALNVVPFLCCLNWLVWFGLFSFALGAVLLSRFGTVPPVITPPPSPPAVIGETTPPSTPPTPIA